MRRNRWIMPLLISTLIIVGSLIVTMVIGQPNAGAPSVVDNGEKN